jgi:hypothetical protein
VSDSDVVCDELSVKSASRCSLKAESADSIELLDEPVRNVDDSFVKSDERRYVLRQCEHNSNAHVSHRCVAMPLVDDRLHREIILNDCSQTMSSIFYLILRC